MQSKAKTVKGYLEELAPERRKQIESVRKVIRKNLPKGFKETMQYGMISYVVPLKLFPEGYLNDPTVPLAYVSLASQKHHMAVYLSNIYSDKKSYDWFRKEYKRTGKRMDVGKSCVRFRKLENLPLELIGEAVAKTSVKDFIKLYEDSRRKR